jgi:hypothetical protein
MAAWSLVNKVSAGGTGQSNALTTAGIVTTSADVLWVVVSSYSNLPQVGDLTDSPAGTFSDSPNTWTLTGTLNGGGGGDVSFGVATFRCISPTTGSAHKFKVTPAGSRAEYPSIIAFALTQGSAPTFVTSTSLSNSSTTIQAGSLGNANDLVCEGLAFYTNNGYSINSLYGDLTEVTYSAGQHMGCAAAWLQVAGASNPTWTASGSNVQIAWADSFTGTGGVGGGSAFPHHYYQQLRG